MSSSTASRVSGSRCAVGSSSTSTAASASRARASASRCRIPPDRRAPCAPTRCRARAGGDVVGEADAVAARRAARSSVASGGRAAGCPRTVRDEHVRVLRHPADSTRRSRRGRRSRTSTPSSVDGAGVRVAEPEQHLGERALARPAGPDHRDAPARGRGRGRGRRAPTARPGRSAPAGRGSAGRPGATARARGPAARPPGPRTAGGVSSTPNSRAPAARTAPSRAAAAGSGATISNAASAVSTSTASGDAVERAVVHGGDPEQQRPPQRQPGDQRRRAGAHARASRRRAGRRG